MNKKFTTSKMLLAISAAVLVVVIGSSAINAPERTYYTNGNSVATFTSCSSCHYNSKADGILAKGSVTITGIPLNSIAGTAYPVSIIIKDAVALCYGFNAIAAGGKFSTSNSATAVSATGKAVHHGSNPIAATPNASDSNYTITGITWTAPVTAGSVKITLCCNAANNNGSTSGDHTYTGTFTTTVAIPTPVTLSSFVASVTLGKANLIWATATELNVASFGIERSIDGINFITIGTVYAVGNSTTTHSYTFSDDASKLNGTFYYRLKTIDKDGKSAYSGIKQVEAKNNKNLITNIFPNPIRLGKDLKLTYISEKAENVNFQLIDFVGNRLGSVNISVNEGSNAISLSLAHLAPGVYYVAVVVNNIIVQKMPVVVQ